MRHGIQYVINGWQVSHLQGFGAYNLMADETALAPMREPSLAIALKALTTLLTGRRFSIQDAQLRADGTGSGDWVPSAQRLGSGVWDLGCDLALSFDGSTRHKKRGQISRI